MIIQIIPIIFTVIALIVTIIQGDMFLLVVNCMILCLYVFVVTSESRCKAWMKREMEELEILSKGKVSHDSFKTAVEMDSVTAKGNTIKCIFCQDKDGECPIMAWECYDCQLISTTLFNQMIDARRIMLNGFFLGVDA